MSLFYIEEKEIDYELTHKLGLNNYYGELGICALKNGKYFLKLPDHSSESGFIISKELSDLLKKELVGKAVEVFSEHDLTSACAKKFIKMEV